MPFFLKSLALLIGYIVAAKVALVFGTINSSVTILWPSGGVALAALLLGGARYLPAVFLAACLTGLLTGASLIFGVGSAVGNTLETYLGFLLIKRFSKVDLELNRLGDLLAIIALGGCLPSVASAVIGPLSLLASGGVSAESCLTSCGAGGVQMSWALLFLHH